MTQARRWLIGTAMAIMLVGGAAGSAAANGPGDHPAEQACFGQHVRDMTKLHGGIGPHIQGMHPDQTVGAHLQMMRSHHC